MQEGPEQSGPFLFARDVSRSVQPDAETGRHDAVSGMANHEREDENSAGPGRREEQQAGRNRRRPRSNTGTIAQFRSAETASPTGTSDSRRISPHRKQRMRPLSRRARLLLQFKHASFGHERRQFGSVITSTHAGPPRSGLECERYLASAFSTADTNSGEDGVTFDSKRAITLPFLSTRNFVKFHLISPPV